VADVFISYSRRDGEFVRELHAFLTEGGRDVWVDWEDIPPASQWAQDIEESIDGADSVVFVVSSSSLASEYCLAELRRALEGGKRIVPLACDGADPGAAPEGLRQLNWIWCREGDDRDEAFAKLTRALDTDLEWAKVHTRLLVRAVEWEARQDGSLLLRGRDLEQAAQQLAVNVGKEPVPTELQQRYVLASRRAAAKRQRFLLGGVSLALAVSVVLGILALLQRNTARRATDAATSVALASTANDRLASHLDQALLLGLAAYSASPSAEARNAVISALEAARRLGVEEFLRGDADVRSVAFSPDGYTVAAGSAEGTVRLWDVRTRKEVGALRAASPIVSVVFARDGHTLAVGSGDGVVQLWDVRARRTVGPPFHAGAAIEAAAFSLDGHTVAASGAAGRVWLWDVRSHRLRPLGGLTGDVGTLVFSPDGQTLAAGTNDTTNPLSPHGTVRLWDVASGQPLGDLPVGWAVQALAFAPGSRTLATGSYASGREVHEHAELQLWNVRRRKALGPALSSSSSVVGLAFAPDGHTLAAGRGDGSIQLLAAPDLKPAGAALRGLEAPSVAFSRDGHTIAGAAVGGVRVWDLRDRGSFGRPIGGGDDYLLGVGFGPDGRTVAAVDDAGVVRRVRVESGRRLAPDRLKMAEYDQVSDVVFSRDGSMLAAVTSLDTVQLWNLRQRAPAGQLRMPRGENGSIGALAFDRAADVLAAVTDAGTILVWDVAHRELLGQPLHVTGDPYARDLVAVAFVGGGRTLLTAAGDGSVAQWDTVRFEASGVALRLPTGGISRAALSPDGRTGAFGSSAGTVWLWDRRGNAQAAELPGGVEGEVTGLAFSADSRTLAVASDGADVRLWDVYTQTPLGEPLRHTDAEAVVFTTTVAFSPDGRVLASGLATIRLWKGILWRDLPDLRAQVCGLVIGDLTRAEWKAIAPGLPYRTTCKR